MIVFSFYCCWLLNISQKTLFFIFFVNGKTKNVFLTLSTFSTFPSMIEVFIFLNPFFSLTWPERSNEMAPLFENDNSIPFDKKWFRLPLCTSMLPWNEINAVHTFSFLGGFLHPNYLFQFAFALFQRIRTEKHQVKNYVFCIKNGSYLSLFK